MNGKDVRGDNMWKELLKTKQIVTPTTDINIKKIPKKKKTNCIERLKGIAAKINNYEFNLKMPPWFPKIIDWKEGFYTPNRYYQIEGDEKWNEALLPELLKINPEWEERINTRRPSGYGNYDALIDIEAYTTSRLKPEDIPEPVACQILKVIDNPEHTGEWMILFYDAVSTGEDWDRYGEWEYFMHYSPNSENELTRYGIEGQGKRVTLYVRSEDNNWLEWELAFTVRLGNHPDNPAPLDESNRKLILNYDEIDVDWTKW
tara:strand:- start:75 stop:854 length:780 start_codon:yes stop_codon:yes gene_type:complete